MYVWLFGTPTIINVDLINHHESYNYGAGDPTVGLLEFWMAV